MEKFTYKKIQLDCIDPDPVHSVRLEPFAFPELLAESIARQGILMPLIVTSAPRPRILAGHLRFAAARKAGLAEIPVLALNAEVSPQEAFLAAVLSNWQRPWEEADRAYCLVRGVREFGMTSEEATQTLLPAMGLEPAKHVFEDYFETGQLEPSLLRAILEKRMPYRGARQLSRFSMEDQKAFAELVADRAALTAQDLLKVQEWLRSLMRQSGLSLEETLAAHGAETILSHLIWDRRMKGDKFCQTLREIAHPTLTAQEKRLAEALKLVTDFSGDFRVEAPPFFEEQGYQLRAKIKNKGDLLRYRQLLEKHSEWLNSLFDFML